ncbi:MAG: CoA activase [Syntrophomonadaceae bacterium]|jgi:predicted CoA-substrate-specific enzyme activase|nr:CoA activase [Syntrophomonadaceae bacterium]
MYFIGIDIGSTAAKTVVLDGEKIAASFILPTGWSSKETAARIKANLDELGIDVEADDTKVIATGYGRISVDYADKVLTEISCHGKGGANLMAGDCVIIDVGGQDTKIITMEKGTVARFLMNDKCSAGTGKFIEIMANRMGVDIMELFMLAEAGTPIPISSMCTVFAESEVISQMGAGKSKEDIAAGIVESVVSRVALLASRHDSLDKYILTGGLSLNPYFAVRLAKKLGQEVVTHEMGIYAGALGAALLAADKFSKMPDSNLHRFPAVK